MILFIFDIILVFRDDIKTLENHCSWSGEKKWSWLSREFPGSRILVELCFTYICIQYHIQSILSEFTDFMSSKHYFLEQIIINVYNCRNVYVWSYNNKTVIDKSLNFQKKSKEGLIIIEPIGLIPTFHAYCLSLLNMER